MTSKTSPAPNQTGTATVTTNYTYDALNRLTNKSYSDGSPSILYLYDSVPWYTSTNSKGRLVETYNGVNDATFFNYDTLGRVVLQNNYTPSNQSSAANPVSASYDLAGNLTALTYPSGRTVTNSYNSAGQLNKVQFTQWTQPGAATLTPYTYWTASDNNFYPNGWPKSFTLGSGVIESTTLNPRLQLQQETVANAAIRTFADHIYNYGSQNNGNIASVTDNLSTTYTQSFTYDALNRLATSTEGRWGLSHVYDAWGNNLQQNVTAGSAPAHLYTVNAQNQLIGGTYDAAGNLKNDGFHPYTYNAENQIVSVDVSATAYTYDAEGSRVRKDVSGTASTEYFYLGGNVIAERNISTGDWTDYVFANGKRIAQTFSYENRIRAYGTANCTSCAAESATYQFAGAGNLNGYVIRSGDTLAVRQTEIGPANVGIVLTFSDGSSSTALSLPDQDGQPLGSDGMGIGSWHSRTVGLTPAQGKTISQVSLAAHPTGAGTWSGYFNDFALFSADGTVHPVFSQQSSVSLIPQATGGISGAGYEVNHDIFAGPYYFSVHYYHGDQIGSSRLMTAAEGWPIWSGIFLPYGEEYNPQITTNHYKYGGHERDSESGLDYFGARHYASALGRFLTPDEPFYDGDLRDPQKLNLYSYVRNNPVTLVDSDGHDVRVCVLGGNPPCFNLTDQQYADLYKQQNGQQGVSMPGGQTPFGEIMCGNQTCGSVEYFEPGLQDESGLFLGGAVSVREGSAIFNGIRTGLEVLFGNKKTVPPPSASGKATVQDILQGAVNEGGSRAQIFSKPGGFAQATKDFEALDGQAVNLGRVRVKDLPNGQGRAVLRDFSKDGRPTLEIQPVGGGYKSTAIRYNP
jgi:RHS repeat-associated protein